MTRLLIVGSKNSLALETIYCTHIKKLGISVSFFDPSEYYKIKDIKDRVNFRYFPSLLYKDANKALMKTIDQESPDLVWIFKGIEFFPETLDKIKKVSIILINYNPDHPFIRTFASSGGRNIVDSVPIYDLHFCYSLALTQAIQAQFNIKSCWLPFGYDLTDREFDSLQFENEIHKVCFVGNPDKIRAKTIESLVTLKYDVDVYGYNWKKFLSPSHNVRIFNQVLGLEYWRTLRKYRLHLNIFRPHNINSHNMRTFEIPASAGIQVAPFSEENELFFDHGKDIFLYKNFEELAEIVQDVLDKPKFEINEIRKSARTSVLNEQCSYESRSRYVVDILNSI